MNFMLRRSLFRLIVLVAGFGLVVLSMAANAQDTTHRGRKYKSPPPTSRIEVTILRDATGKPVENASVVFHVVGDKGNMELKTNEDGKAVIDVLPTGSTVLLQVIAKGFQTYGNSYTIAKDQMAIEVKLKRPGEQYSIYKKPGESAGAGKSPDAGQSSDKDKPADADKDSAPKDKSADAAKQPDAKPDATQPQPQ
jgi:hypothetical protein